MQRKPNTITIIFEDNEIQRNVHVKTVPCMYDIVSSFNGYPDMVVMQRIYDFREDSFTLYCVKRKDLEKFDET